MADKVREVVRIPATPEEASKMPPPPNGGLGTDIYHWTGEALYRIQVGDKHYVYRSLPGMESWMLVEGEHSGAPKGEVLTLEELSDMGVPLPPGGTYSDVYAVQNEHCLRASTVTGDWFCVDPKAGWLSTRFHPGDAQTLKLAVEANILMDRWYPEVERPDSECSVRIQNIRKSDRERKAREAEARDREAESLAAENEARWAANRPPAPETPAPAPETPTPEMEGAETPDAMLDELLASLEPASETSETPAPETPAEPAPAKPKRTRTPRRKPEA